MNQVKIGRFIAAMRKQQHLTQREFAELLGVSDKTVSKWECGNGMPELSYMQSVCKILQIDLNELFSGERLTDTDYKKKAEENMMNLIEEAESLKKNIVGGSVLGTADDIEMDKYEVHRTNTAFWSTAGNELLGATALPAWGNFFPSEDKLRLLGALTGKSVLEIGCGGGHSLKYAADSGAADLYGLDISEEQIGRAREYLASQGINAKLVCSPMEEECGLPTDYFDLVYSVYGIGWTTDLNRTFERVRSYLKKDGIFVFGWSHPIHKCVSIEKGRLVFDNSYFDEKWYSANIGDREIMLSNRMMSTYVNVLADSGFVIEKLVEEIDRERAAASGSDFGRKALMLPTVFVIRARKG